MKRNIFIVLAILLFSTLTFKGAFARLTIHSISDPVNSIIAKAPEEEPEQIENAPMLLMMNPETIENPLSEDNELISEDEIQIIEGETKEEEPIQQTEEIDSDVVEEKEEGKEETDIQNEEVKTGENEENPVEQLPELPEQPEDTSESIETQNSVEETNEDISINEE